jgi:hypothetical protein fuD12_10852
MNLIRIEDKELTIKEWNGQRVVTAKDIAELHERDVKRVNEQFNRNIKKFELGKDYFQLTREEMRKSQFATALSKYSNNDIENLFTERGYLKLTKTFNDELSWKIQDMLVDSYFTLKTVIKEIKQTEAQKKRLEIMDRNSKVREANMWYKLLSQTKTEKHKEVILSYSTRALNGGKEVIPLPLMAQRTLTATEIGDMIGVTGNKIGRLANKYNLKTDDYGYYVHDKAKYSNKEIPNFVYFEHAIEKFKKLLEAEKVNS